MFGINRQVKLPMLLVKLNTGKSCFTVQPAVERSLKVASSAFGHRFTNRSASG